MISIYKDVYKNDLHNTAVSSIYFQHFNVTNLNVIYAYLLNWTYFAYSLLLKLVL